MTRTPPAPRGLTRAALIVALALAGALLAALTTTSRADARADAAFTTAQCQGADILGRGASFARDAHQVFRLHFTNTFCSGSAPAVDYAADGSGAGRRAVGERSGSNSDGSQARNQAARFGMSDEPPAQAGVAQMNMGTDAPGDEDKIHVIPAAVGAVVPIVNFPDACDVNLLASADKTAEENLDGDATPDDVVRVRFSKSKLDKAFAKDGDADNWTELFPELAGDADCNKPIIRVVRFDDSGTTFTLKDYLDRANGGRDWIPTFSGQTPGLTRNWPNATFGARGDCLVSGVAQQGPGSQDDATDQLTSGCGSGNGPLVAKLSATDGSIGYSDLSTARTAGLAITPEGNDNDTYFTQIPNGAGGAPTSGPLAGNQFTEATADARGFRTDGLNGSNCQSTQFTGIPTSTLGDWAAASGVNSPTGFGACTLTYGLLFDDYKKAYALQPDQASEERKARTVKDYWTDIVSDGGQAVLFGRDYAPLPADIRAIAKAGVDAVGWDKAASGGTTGGGTTGGGTTGGGTTGGGTTGGGTTGGGTTGGNPSPAAPDNRFSVPRIILSRRTGNVTLSVRVPGPGTIVLGGRAGKTRVGGLRARVSSSGTYRLTIKAGRKAKRALRRRGRLRIRVTIKYTPRGGTTRRASRTVTLQLRKPGKGRRGGPGRRGRR